ncbi:MAG: hypothetical protein MUO64_19080 [Anaerolineales bacterium]|nr:hypothetical protein [Anaerolineales bacterium]
MFRHPKFHKLWKSKGLLAFRLNGENLSSAIPLHIREIKLVCTRRQQAIFTGLQQRQGISQFIGAPPLSSVGDMFSDRH